MTFTNDPCAAILYIRDEGIPGYTTQRIYFENGKAAHRYLTTDGRMYFIPDLGVYVPFAHSPYARLGDNVSAEVVSNWHKDYKED